MRWYTTLLLCVPALATAQSANESTGITGGSGLPTNAGQTNAGTPSSFWWGDFDGDGFADAYVIQPSGPGRLLHNLGDGSFEDATENAGLAGIEAVEMALWSDVDADGRPDLFLLAYRGTSRLLRQELGGVFAEVTEMAGLDALANPIDARWFDYDNDGRPDLLLTTLNDERLYHNLGRFSFEEVELGLGARPAVGAGAGANPTAPPTIDEARATRDLPPVAPKAPSGGGRIPLGPGPGFTATPVTPLNTVNPASGFCAPFIVDTSNPGSCLPGSSVPLLGMLYPLSFELFVDGGTGYVGMGTLTPGSRLDVVGGDIRTDSMLISTTTAGPPLSVSSAQRVPNLNVDLLDGLDSTAFSQLGASIEGAEITDGTIAAADLGANSVGASEIAANAVGNTELANAAVTSAKVASGTISDTHVSASAAIAGSKIDADFGGQNVRTSNQLVSTTSGQPPFVVSSTYLVPNLNADFIDGVDSSVFSQLGNSIEGSEITDRTIGPNDLDWPLTGPGVPKLFWAEATGSGGIAVEANSTSGSGFSRGVVGTTSSVSGMGVEGWAKATTGPAYGVHARSDSSGGTGLLAEAPSATGTTYGVQGLVISPNGTGVFGDAQASSGVTSGVHGRTATAADDGAGVFGEATSATGLTIGVHGKSFSSAGTGVRGEAGNYGVHGTGGVGVRGDSSDYKLYGVLGFTTGVSGTGVFGQATADGTSWPNDFSAGVRGQSAVSGSYTAGVIGETSSDWGCGVYAMATSTTGGAKGLYAETEAASGDAVYGRALHTSGAAWGVRGETASPGGYGVYCSGDFAATGSKSFVQPHPEDPGQEIHFVCLEGNESGTYFRGSGRLENGRAVIEVPEEFRMVSSTDGLTVMVTATGAPALLWVQSKSLERIVVRGNLDAEFDYFVNGVRRGYEKYRAIRENLSFVPSVSGVEFGTQYPEALRQVLVENGTLNPDYTPNELTAAAQGWTLRPPLVTDGGGVPGQSGPSAKPQPAAPPIAPDPLESR